MRGQLTDVGVINLGQESHFWRCHWVFFRQEQFQLEYTSFIACEWRENRKERRAHAGTDSHQAPQWSHRNSAGCRHEAGQRFPERGLRRGVRFPVCEHATVCLGDRGTGGGTTMLECQMHTLIIRCVRWVKVSSRTVETQGKNRGTPWGETSNRLERESNVISG